MTTVQAEAAASPSFWEDLINIFYQPSDVFRRRQFASVWPPLLFVAISIGVIFAVTYGTLQPLFDAEFARTAAKAMAKNPQVTQEMMDKTRGFSENITRYGVGIIMLATMFIVGCVAWLVGRAVGSSQTFHAALVVAAWAFVPRILGAVFAGVQGLVMDPSRMTSQMSISLSPARFLDPDTSNPFAYQLLGRLDVTTVWVTVLLAIGLFATGNVSKQRAVVFGVLIWVVGSLPALRQAYMLV